MNEAARVNKQRELEMLNGGIAIQLTDTAYEVVELPLSFATCARKSWRMIGVCCLCKVRRPYHRDKSVSTRRWGCLRLSWVTV